ncbi:MAG: FAD-binding oxidoreductase [Geodermatophilaceae bacterium]
MADVGRHRYDESVARLRASYAAIPPGAPVRLAKRTSNLFRARARAAHGLDVSGLSGLLSVDPAARTADVLGMTTYEDLVDATLPYGLMPLVVPQLKTITLGGAVTGLGIESTSFRNGTPHESVLEMDVLTGDGRLVTARPDNEHAELFFGFPNSYGTLGYALRLRIELEPVRSYVRLRHVRFGSAPDALAALAAICAGRSHEGEPVDFLDGTVFTPGEVYLTLGTFADAAPDVSDYTSRHIYYRSLQQRREDHLTVRDYLWRWDTDWFWCSRAFGVQNPRVRRLVPSRLLRSDTYWRLIALEQRFGIVGRIDRARGRAPEERVVQDIEVPVERAAEFLEFLHRDTGIAPVWLCPLQQRDARTWDLYELDPDTLYVNIGFWSTVALRPGEADGIHNRRIEEEVTRLGGRKSLYSTAYYPEAEFWATYNGESYRKLKQRYDPDGRLLDLYGKTVRAR